MNEILKLEDAIKHSYDKYIELKDKCKKCSQEHYQLYLWLEELKEYREATKENYIDFSEILNRM